jgi:CheY-like chemotaxis protein/HPt (histidine-containing phosphotransfer) domain-containing protein
MTGIMGICDLFAAGEQSPEQTRMVKMLRRSAQTLLDLLNDILDLAKIEAGRLTIESVDFDLSALLLEIQNLFASAMSEKGLGLIVDGAAETGEAFRGDPKRLRQILCNLVGNALKFTDAGTVHVRHWQDAEGKVLTFSVSDTGVGISEDGLKRLFRKFEQEDATTARRYGGTGLGLAISKQLAEAMGGTIAVESTKGKGTTFTFSVRVEPGDAAKVLTSALEVPGQAGKQQLAGRRLRILLAEDNPTSRFIIERMLGQWGHDVTSVSDGRQAVTHTLAEKFDVILMDMQMPIMDGDEAARLIRASGSVFAETPIIALTADGIVEHHQNYINAGCNSVVTKPVSWNVLAKAIAVLLAPASEHKPEPDERAQTAIDRFSTLNGEMIEALKAAFQPGEFGKLLERSVDTITDYKLKLEGDIAAANHLSAKRTAHGLKGLSSQIGADEVAALAAWIEEKSATIEDVASAIPRLSGAIQRLNGAVADLISATGAARAREADAMLT